MKTEVSVIHRVRIVASFALLGALVAGAAGAFPMVAAVIPAALDLHAIGAVIGGIAGTVTQVAHQA
jgi:hypothetical protein